MDTAALPGVAAPVRQASTRLTWRDRLGALRVRLGIARHAYSVEPGLYQVGAPSAESPVLVTANYKLTFDTVRAAIVGLDVWLLVLDTKGINVWCAAGKGTFGTRGALLAHHLERPVRRRRSPHARAPAARGSRGGRTRGQGVH